MNKTIIIQARMGSSRLPGKSLKFLNGIPIIQRCYEQCLKSKLADGVIVAIPNSKSDDILFNFCKENNLNVFRGDSNNLVDRYYNCAKENNVDMIVRITGDNPVVDPSILDLLIEEHISKKGDYTSTRHWDKGNNKLTGLYPAGLSVDIFNFNSLKEMYNSMDTLTNDEKEHIVYYFLKDKFNLVEVSPDQKLDFIFTIDTQEQFDQIELLIKHFEKNLIEFNYENFKKIVPELFSGSVINKSKEYNIK